MKKLSEKQKDMPHPVNYFELTPEQQTSLTEFSRCFLKNKKERDKQIRGEVVLEQQLIFKEKKVVACKRAARAFVRSERFSFIH